MLLMALLRQALARATFPLPSLPNQACCSCHTASLAQPPASALQPLARHPCSTSPPGGSPSKPPLPAGLVRSATGGWTSDLLHWAGPAQVNGRLASGQPEKETKRQGASDARDAEDGSAAIDAGEVRQGRRRNERKRAAQAARDFGLELVELNPKELAKVVRWAQLPEETLEAVTLAKALTRKGKNGWRRQVNYIGGLLRGINATVLTSAVKAAKEGTEFVPSTSEE